MQHPVEQVLPAKALPASIGVQVNPGKDAEGVGIPSEDTGKLVSMP
jgi:hypothetical protein